MILAWASPFKCGSLDIDIVSKYKYLGLWFNEHYDVSIMANLRPYRYLQAELLVCLFQSIKLLGVFLCLVIALFTTEWYLPYLNMVQLFEA